MKSYKVTVDDDDNGAGALLAVSFIISAIITIIGIIAGIFAAFTAVGIVWGTIKSIVNYCKGIANFGVLKIGSVVKFTWNANVEEMQLFFDKANYYDHILPVLVKTFLVASGVGLIIVGTITIPVWLLFHLMIALFVKLLRLKKTE